jgi:hypothetical protein
MSTLFFGCLFAGLIWEVYASESCNEAKWEKLESFDRSEWAQKNVSRTKFFHYLKKTLPGKSKTEVISLLGATPGAHTIEQQEVYDYWLARVSILLCGDLAAVMRVTFSDGRVTNVSMLVRS